PLAVSRKSLERNTPTAKRRCDATREMRGAGQERSLQEPPDDAHDAEIPPDKAFEVRRYDRHSHDLEKRAALDFWGKRLEAIVRRCLGADIEVLVQLLAPRHLR